MGRKDQVVNVDKYLEEAYTTLVVNDFYGVSGDTAAVVQHLASDMGLSTKRVAHVVAKLIEDKYLIYSKKEGGLLDGRHILKGVFHPYKEGKGFVTVEGMARDLKVKGTKYAREGDIVEVVYFGEEMPENLGVSRVVKRVNDHVVGVVAKNEEGHFVLRPLHEPYSREYLLPPSESTANFEGQICSMKITVFESSKGCGAGTIEKSFGFADDPIAQNGATAYKYGFVKDFPEDVMAEVARIPDHVTPEEMQGRLDLRHLPIISCDPKSCKDKDDAYYIERTAAGYRAYVAIADVSHYVRPGSAIDKEALHRGTSCYIGDGVYPMLPPALSNGICSLHAGVDRLAVVSIIDFDNNGNIINTDVQRAVVNIKHSISYEEQEAIYLAQDGMDKKFADIKPVVDLLYEGHRVLDRNVKSKGKIEFETDEPKYIFDSTKTKVIDVVGQGQEESHAVVESFMILNNVAIATRATQRGLNVARRNHQPPTEDKINFFNRDLKAFGINYTVKDYSKSFQTLMDRADVKSSKYYPIIVSKGLRSMQKANYGVEREGHFALGLPEYLHWTSPIRRYVDLVNHRIIFNDLEQNSEWISRGRLETLTQHLSERDRAAESAENEANKGLNANYAEGQIGRVFDGYVKDIGSREITVGIKNNLVNLTVPVAELQGGYNAHYKASDNHMHIVDVRTGHKYSLGDTVPVMIASVDRSRDVIVATTDLHKKLERPAQIRPEVKLPSAADLPRFEDVVRKLPETLGEEYTAQVSSLLAPHEYAEPKLEPAATKLEQSADQTQDSTAKTQDSGKAQ